MHPGARLSKDTHDDEFYALRGSPVRGKRTRRRERRVVARKTKELFCRGFAGIDFTTVRVSGCSKQVQSADESHRSGANE
jgi:hypothetical protein